MIYRNRFSALAAGLLAAVFVFALSGTLTATRAGDPGFDGMLGGSSVIYRNGRYVSPPSSEKITFPRYSTEYHPEAMHANDPGFHFRQEDYTRGVAQTKAALDLVARIRREWREPGNTEPPPPYKISWALCKAATLKAQQMLRLGYFAHANERALEMSYRGATGMARDFYGFLGPTSDNIGIKDGRILSGDVSYHISAVRAWEASPTGHQHLLVVDFNTGTSSGIKDDVQYMGYGFAWHRPWPGDGSLTYAQMAFVFMAGTVPKEQAYLMREGIPADTVGSPDDTASGVFTYGSTWEGFAHGLFGKTVNGQPIDRPQVSVLGKGKKAGLVEGRVGKRMKARVVKLDGVPKAQAKRARFTLAKGRLPRGLRLNARNGRITGRPKQAGKRTVQIAADYGAKRAIRTPAAEVRVQIKRR